MNVFVSPNQPGEVELAAENADDNFLLGKLAVKLKNAQVYPPGNNHGRTVRFQIIDLVRVATEINR